MSRKSKILLALFLVFYGAAVAWATNDTIGVTVGSGKIANLISFASTRVISETGVCDATTENQCAAVSAGGAVSVNITSGLNSNGQATMANSAPVAIASNQSAIPVTQSGTWTDRVVGNAGGAFDAATGAAPPANALYQGVLESGATGGHVAAPINCDNHVFKHITTATDTMFVQGVASQVIYVCSWRSRAAGVATWLLETEADQSATCNGTLAQINGIATEAANTGETWGGNFWSGLKTSAGFGLCAKSTGTGGVDVDVWYAQF